MSDSSKNTSCSGNAELYQSQKIIKALAQILTEIIEENKYEEMTFEFKERQKKFAFTAKKPPSICIQSYIERILKYTHLEDSSLVIALILIDRACEISDIVLNECNVHRYLNFY